MTLTSKKVRKLLCAGAVGKFLDQRGLYLCVQSRTAAHWEKRYQYLGREHYTGLGSAFVFSLKQARERSRRASELLADGIDPLARKREAKAAAIAAAARSVTFGACAEDFYKTNSPTWKHIKHAQQWRSSVLGLTLGGKPVEQDHCRLLRALPVQEIDTPIILSVLKPHWHEKAESMNRLRARIAAVIDSARAAGYRRDDSINPADWSIIGKVLPAPGKVAAVNHFEAVPYAQVSDFVTELRKREGSAARCLEFLIYTVARSAEAREATWGEIDLDGATWTIAAERMKAAKPHVVPLADPVINLLRRLPREGDGDDALVFVGPKSGKPLTDLALMTLMRKLKRSEVVHGFRSSFSDWAHETTGYSSIVIEQSLAHAVGSAVERAYRRSNLLTKRRRLLSDWARFCCMPPVVETGEVVQIGRGRA